MQVDVHTLDERLRIIEQHSNNLLEVRAWREKVLLALVAFLFGALLTGLSAGIPHSHRLAILEERQQGLIRDIDHLTRAITRQPYGGDSPAH
jgi:hypothetical protein